LNTIAVLHCGSVYCVYAKVTHKTKASAAGSKPTGVKAAEANVKPSEMLLDLNDDCEHHE